MAPTTRARRGVRIVLRCLLVLVGALLLPELALRFLLFGDSALAVRLGASLRRPELFAIPQSREHWALQARFHPMSEKFRPLLDPELGFRSEEIDAHTYRHADEAQLRGRRPVLLYGDSFAQCASRPEQCWQGLMEDSDLAARFALLNYGVGGYGFDQACLLLERTVDLYRALDPVVIVGVLVDDDLDRCFLLVRDYPKPHFELERDELVLRPPPPVSPTCVIEAPLDIRSYLWNALVCGTGLVPAEQRTRWLADGGRDALVSELSVRLVRRVHAALAARQLEHFFLLFHARPSAQDPGPFTWREPLLYETFERERIPFVSSKRYLWQSAHDEGHALADFYISSEAKRGKNHYTPAAQRVVFEAIRAGLERRYESYEYLPGVPSPVDVKVGSR